jgi:hypothetical protein
MITVNKEMPRSLLALRAGIQDMNSIADINGGKEAAIKLL